MTKGNSTYPYDPSDCPNDGTVLHMSFGKDEYRCPKCGVHLNTCSSRVLGMIDDRLLFGYNHTSQPAEHPLNRQD